MNRAIQNNNKSLPPLPSPPTSSNQTINMENNDDLDSSTRSSRGVARNSSNSAKFHPNGYYGSTEDTINSSNKQDDINIFLSPVRTKNNTSSYFPPRSPFKSPRYNNSGGGAAAMMRSVGPSRRYSPRKAHHDHDNDNDHTDDILNGLFRESSLRIHSVRKELETDNMDSLSSMLENSRNGLCLDDSSDDESDEESSLGDDIITASDYLLED